MKLAFVYPPMLVGGRPLDFSAIDTSPRGTTGSEIQILSMAREMAALGHEIALFIAQDVGTMPPTWEGVHLAPFDTLKAAVASYDFDAVCVSLDVNVFRGLACLGAPIRVLFQQYNDFNYAAGPDFADFVDLIVSPSKKHRENVETDWPTTKGKWVVIPNGVRMADHEGVSGMPEPRPIEWMWTKRIPGRVIYASSPDRGLHLLLQEWPAIKKAVPHATLKIFYFALYRWINEWKPYAENAQWSVLQKELYRRAMYVEKALNVLKDYGVEGVGSVSRQQMALEMAQAEVLAYPCDTIAYTEGFSCATLEGCASGALPIISAADALGGIYRGVCPMVAAPARKHIARWRKLVIQALTDKPWADEWRARGREFALFHDWRGLATQFERVLQEKIQAAAPATSNEKPPIDFILTSHATSGVTIDPQSQTDSACGGSRAGCLNLAKAMARHGYPVRIRSQFTGAAAIEGVVYEPQETSWRPEGRIVFAYFDTAPLDQAAGARLRIASHHSYSPPAYNWGSAALHTAPSSHTLNFLRGLSGLPSSRWAVLPNAVADEGIVMAPVRGRVIYHTSPDRGLFHLLNVWGAIHKAAPHATLHVVGRAHECWWGDVQSLRTALARVKDDPSITFLGPLPREAVRRELSEASLFAFPCLPSGPTESFSISVMECCKLGIPVVLIPADALEEVYNGVVVMASEATFTMEVINALRWDMRHVTEREKAYAAQFTYDAMAERLGALIEENL